MHSKKVFPLSVDEMNELRKTKSDTAISKMYWYTFSSMDVVRYAWRRNVLKIPVIRESRMDKFESIFTIKEPTWTGKIPYTKDEINDIRRMWVPDKKIANDLKISVWVLLNFAWLRKSVNGCVQLSGDMELRERINEMRDLWFSDTYISQELSMPKSSVSWVAWRRTEYDRKKNLQDSNIELLSERVLNDFVWEQPVENRYWENLDWFQVAQPIWPMRWITLLPNTWAPLPF